MKNILLFFFILPLICTGCDKDNEDIVPYSNDPINNPVLSGTRWINTNEYDKWEFIQTLFFSETHCELVMDDYEIKIVDGKKVKTLYGSEALQGTYTYQHSKGTITIDGVEGIFTIHKKTLLIKGQHVTEVYAKE